MFLLPEFLTAANSGKPDFWVRSCRYHNSYTGQDDLDQSLVMNMQGRKVVMQFHASFTGGLNYSSRFFHVKTDNFDKIMTDTGTESDPELRINNIILKTGSPVSATFDGMLTFNYPENKGINVSRTIFPSNSNALVIEEWQLRNNSGKTAKMSVSASRQIKYAGEDI